MAYINNNDILFSANVNIGSSSKLQEKSITPTTQNQEVTPDSGYDGLSKVNVEGVQTENINLTPTQWEETVYPTYGKFISKVVMSAVDSSIDSNIQAENIKKDTTILGVTGTYEGGGAEKPTQTKTVDPATSQQVVSADEGYELASVTVNAVTSSIDQNIQAENIKKDTTILGVTGTYEGTGGTGGAGVTSYNDLTDKPIESLTYNATTNELTIVLPS